MCNSRDRQGKYMNKFYKTSYLMKTKKPLTKRKPWRLQLK